MISYKGKIKVVGLDMLCFPADPKTLEPLSCSCYDPWAYTDKSDGAIEVIDVNEWNLRYMELEFPDLYKQTNTERIK